MESWIKARLAIEESQNDWFEWQAHCFAGLVLVPRRELKSSFQEAISRVTNAGVDANALSDSMIHTICGSIAREFMVSTAVVEIRVKYDKLA